MRIALLLLALLLFGSADTNAQQPIFRSREGWTSAEKPLHLYISALTTFGAAELAHKAGIRNRTAARVVGAGFAATLGIAKEWMDVRRGGWADPQDLVWDAAGIAIGFHFALHRKGANADHPLPVPPPAQDPTPIPGRAQEEHPDSTSSP